MLALVLLLGAVAGAQKPESQLKLQIHGSAGSTETVWFIQKQLLPAAEKYGKSVVLEFIPWGRTVRNKNGELMCPFGGRECWANRVHRCALSLLRNQRARLDYLNCEYASDDSRPAFLAGTSQICGSKSGINATALNYCVAHGEHLDRKCEEASAEAVRLIDFVPALVFNGDIDIVKHRLTFKNLQCMIIKLLS